MKKPIGSTRIEWGKTTLELTEVQRRMTVGTKCYKVLFGVIPDSTAKLFVMNLKVFHPAADLTSPAISTQHLPSQPFVGFGIEPKTGALGLKPIHEAAFSVTCFRNTCRCSPGRNLKKREIEFKSTSGFSPSRFAPARKSAQIISRQ
jgi:hypothetical protein